MEEDTESTSYAIAEDFTQIKAKLVEALQHGFDTTIAHLIKSAQEKGASLQLAQRAVIECVWMVRLFKSDALVIRDQLSPALMEHLQIDYFKMVLEPIDDLLYTQVQGLLSQLRALPEMDALEAGG